MTTSRDLPNFKLGHAWQNSIFALLAMFSLFFLASFFMNNGVSSSIISNSFFEFSFDKFSLFLASIFCVSLFIGLYPVRDDNDVTRAFLFYILGGLGIILSNNLLTFFVFWSFQRSLPAFRFIRGIRNDSTSGGGTYLIQHFITFVCLSKSFALNPCA